MTVLSSKSIMDRLFHENPQKRLVITPIISHEDQIAHGSVDLRLGTEFIITKRTKYHLLDPMQENIESQIEQYQDKIYIGYKRKLILQPHQFILGSTLEYIKLPNDLLGYVIGRSSWGRVGLIIATATMVGPGFSGSLTLELVNLGEANLALYPGTRIAQLVLHTMDDEDKGYISKPEAKYIGAVGPEFSKIHTDKEWKLLK
ncbi:MAG: dCTP deaminase [Candidatus Freyarchaeota archaeon]